MNGLPGGSGGGWVNKLFMFSLAIIAVSIALQMSIDTIRIVLTPMLPWIAGTVVLLLILLAARLIHRYMANR